MKIMSLIPSFARRKALPAPVPEPVAHQDDDPLSIAFRIAAYGRKFSTQSYHKPLLQTGDVEYMRAVAVRPDHWRVIKVIQQHKLFGGEEQIRVLAEKASFVEAAEILLGYEITATGMGLARVEETRVHGFDHVLDFCLREGLVPDMNGKLHPLIDGEIVTPGQFETAHLQKAGQFSNGHVDAALNLPQQWHATFLEDLFQQSPRTITWKALNQDIKNAALMKDFIFRVKSICLMIDMLNANGQDESAIDLDEFIMASDYQGSYWKHKTVKEWQREDNMIGSMQWQTLERFDGETVQGSIGDDMVAFLRDLYAFDLTRRIKWNLAKCGDEMPELTRQHIDGWITSLKKLMAQNGHSPEMIKRAEFVALNAEVLFDSIPSVITDRINKFEEYYFALQNNIESKRGLKPDPQLPLFPS